MIVIVTPLPARFSARTAAASRSINLRMKALYNLEKRCHTCEHKYLVPIIRESRMRELVLLTYPCPNCTQNLIGRCIEVTCLIPFRIRSHHAKGRCLRCYNALLRDDGRIS